MNRERQIMNSLANVTVVVLLYMLITGIAQGELVHAAGSSPTPSAETESSAPAAGPTTRDNEESQETTKWYFGIYGGVGFPDRFRDVRGTGSIRGVTFSDLALATTGVYGAKIGSYAAGARWIGAEAEIYLANPHVKQQRVTASVANLSASTLQRGLHVTTIVSGINLLVRYPHEQFQPYAGLGLALVTATLSDNTMRSVSRLQPGLNLLAGVRTMITPSVSLFTELKYTYASLSFDDVGVQGAGIEGTFSMPSVVFGVAIHFR